MKYSKMKDWEYIIDRHHLWLVLCRIPGMLFSFQITITKKSFLFNFNFLSFDIDIMVNK